MYVYIYSNEIWTNGSKEKEKEKEKEKKMNYQPYDN